MIKEYRFDRIIASISEFGFFGILKKYEFRLPKKSIRNVLIFIIHLIFLLLLIYLSDYYNRLIFTLGLVLTSPVLAFLSSSLAVVLTKPFSLVKNNIIIKKARRLINKYHVEFIGITGSYGKSSIKEFLCSVLSSKYKTAKTNENYNTKIGVAISILSNLKKETKFFIAEMGAYRKGEIQEICTITKPKYGIITAVGNQHLALFKTKENIIKTKLELARALPRNGVLYINQNIEIPKKIAKSIKARIVFFSKKKINNKTSAYIKQIEFNPKTLKTNAKVHCYNDTFNITTILLGSHNVLNLLPVICLAKDLSLNKNTITQAISRLNQMTNKLSLHKGPNSSLIISDSLNSNPDGFLSALDFLHSFPQSHKVVVTKGLIELGKEKLGSYKQIIKIIRKQNIRMYTTDELFQKIEANIIYAKTEGELYNRLLSDLTNDSVVLIEGRFSSLFINKIIK